MHRRTQPLAPSTAAAVSNEQAVKEQLIKLTNAVRSKYRELKREVDDTERYVEARTKPFVKPIVESIKKAMPLPMVDLKKAVKRESFKRVRQEPKVEGVKRRRLSDDETSFNKSTDASIQTEPDNLIDIYVSRLTSPAYQSMIDSTYGVRLDGHGGALIGDSKVTFGGNRIIIQDKSFKVTPGLMELLFMKVPEKEVMTTEDVLSYKNILIMTNGHRQMYSAEKPINASRGKKYTNVISQMFPAKKTTGSGYKEYNINANTLVNRLRLLVMSEAAGHTAHKEEIQEITNLLRLYKVIL